MDEASNTTLVLDKITEQESVLVTYCLDLPSDLSGEISLGVIAYKDQSQPVYKGVITDFQLMAGTCKGNLRLKFFCLDDIRH